MLTGRRRALLSQPRPLVSLLTSDWTASIGTGSLQTDQGATVTCARASTKYCTLANGSLVLLSANQISVEAKGINVEGASTNLSKWSQNLGAGSDWSVAGSGGSQTAPVVTSNTTDVTAPDGTSTATKAVFAATTAANQYVVLQHNAVPAPAPSTVHTTSMYIRATAPGTFYAAMDAGTTQTYSAMAVTTAWQRLSFTWTSSAGGTAAVLNLGSDTRAGNANEPVMSAQTVYIWGVQVEALPSATSLIPTTAAAVTRPKDVITLGTLTGLSGKISISADAYFTQAGLSAGGVLYDFSNSGSDQLYGIGQSTLKFAFYNGSINPIVAGPATAVFDGVTKNHFCNIYDGSNVIVVTNGSSTTTTTAVPFSTSYTATAIGSDLNGSNQSLYGWLSNIKVFATPETT